MEIKMPLILPNSSFKVGPLATSMFPLPFSCVDCKHLKRFQHSSVVAYMDG
jgi:hypothetical protein